MLCPQAQPAWSWIGQKFAAYVAAGNATEFNFTAAQEEVEVVLGAGPPEQDPATTEDCLFLDVVVPKSIYENACPEQGAPVVVWYLLRPLCLQQLTQRRIFGGGFTAGSKDRFDPSQLIKASQDEVIFVAMNHRIGALGFLSGSTMQESGGQPNAGLLDQRLAIDWVADNIHLFGGDPNQITLMGQSSGGKLIFSVASC